MNKLTLALLLFSSTLAYAHGGLPVSSAILRQGGGDTMYVPVVFWGVWVGQPGQKWRWICEEEINPNRLRHIALSTDGAFYATDLKGITLSTDNGCTWTPATGDIATRRITDVVAHPSDGATAWITTGDSGPPLPDGGVGPGSNGVYVTHDHGATWTPLAGLAAESALLFEAVRVAPSNANVLYVTSVQVGSSAAPTVHRTDDGGLTFHDYPLQYQLAGVTPHSLDIMGVDPRNPLEVYMRATVQIIDDAGSSVTLKQSLLRSIDGGQTFTEVLALDGTVTPSGMSHGIDGIGIDGGKGKLYVATSMGVFEADDPPGATSLQLQPIGNLSQAQCIDVHGGNVFACSNDYAPDNAALAQSTDDGQSFQSILRYVDTEGPVDCPASTPVGSMCPLYWSMYGSQLGIAFDDAGVAVDGGTTNMGGGGCQIDVARGGGSVGAALALVALLLVVARRRRA